MRSLFNRDSPQRLRNNNNDGGGGRGSSSSNHQNESSKQRKSFAFMKYSSEERRSSTSMKASREHARQIAMTLSQQPASQDSQEDVRGSTFQPSFPAPQPSALDFNPFGHTQSSTSFACPPPPVSTSSTRRSSSKRRSKPTATATSPPPPSMSQPQEDFFAQASQQDFFSQAPAAPPVAPRGQQQQQQRVQPAASSSVTGSSFDNESRSSTGGGGASAFDNMDSFLSSSQQRQYQQPQQRENPSQRRISQQGRPPPAPKSSSEVSFGSMSSSQWPSTQSQPLAFSAPPPQSRPPQQQQQQQIPKQSMSTFPSNSSMQSSFAGPVSNNNHPNTDVAAAPQMVSHTPPPIFTPPPSSAGGGAAARRRMRSQMRISSNSSLAGSVETGSSFDGGTPPASPMSGRRILTANSNVSVGSSGAGAGQQQPKQHNRLSSYTISGQQQQSHRQGQTWQHSPSPSIRGSGASVCSSVAESDVDLFDNQNGGGGFTFDAFGLDAQAIDREVQEAMQAIHSNNNDSSSSRIFNPFGFGGNSAGGGAASANTSISSTARGNNSGNHYHEKPQDISGDDFEPQGWDSPPGSPPGSRRETPVQQQHHEREEEEDGFVDGFRVSKPSPLPQISVHRSPASSERSSSLSSITDHNTDNGAPRRNVFKERAGFGSSHNGKAPPAKKAWMPPPGAQKMLTPPRHGIRNQQRQHHLRQRQQQQPLQQVPRVQEADEDNDWNDHLSQIDNLLMVESAHDRKSQSTPSLAEQQQRPVVTSTVESNKATPIIQNKWNSAAPKRSTTTTRQRPQQPGMPQPAKKFSGEQTFQKVRQEEKKEDDESEERDNHTDTTSAMTTVLSEAQSSPPQRPSKQVLWRSSLETDLPKDEEMDLKDTSLSPQELRKRELEDLRSKGANSSALKSQAAMLHNTHNNDVKNTLKPQQQRANECNNQRTSFASHRERLKSPVEQGQNKMSGSGLTNSPQQHSVFFASQVSPQSAKSEVGVSSFTRQKMKISSLSSTAKSEVGYGRSPRNHHQPEVTSAVMSKMREMNLASSSSSAPKNSGVSPAGVSSAPAFMAVKLRKTVSPPGLQSTSSNEIGGGASMDSHEQRKVTYRERCETELQEQQLGPPQSSPRRDIEPMSQAQKMTMRQETDVAQEQMRAQSPKRPSYRERREIELAQERDLKQQQQKGSAQTNEVPKRDVAASIRRRIAANKTTGVISPSSEGSQQLSPFSRDLLQPTSFSGQQQVESSQPSRESDNYDGPMDEHDNEYEAHGGRQQSYENQEKSDNYDAPRDERDIEYAAHGGRQQSYEKQAKVSPQLEILPPRESDLPSQREHSQNQPPVSASDGGLSGLHAQLNQLQNQQPEEEVAPGIQEPHAQKEEKTAPRRVQAMLEGRPQINDLEISIAHSQSSDQHGSPTRTPKATYAMLNAFLHGRETISAHDEKPAESKPEEDDRDDGESAYSSPKHTMASTSGADLNDGRPALKDDPAYARYFTMLKIGMPMDVVKHAMIRDNLDPGIMDGDHNKSASTGGGTPLKDDPKYTKYFKMLKIGMPMEAVKHAMERDGLDSHVMDQDHNLPADPNQGKQDDGPKEKDSHRRSRLHWKPIREVRRNSLWAKIDEDPDLDNIEIDEEEFAELFQSEIQTDAQQAKKGKRIKSPRKGAGVRVIDPKRANNGGIILARLKMSHDDMADVVDRIDENGMTGEQIEHVIEYLPTTEERRALEAYMLEGGQDAAEKFDGLCECEKFMVSMMTVKHAKRKVRALLFKLQFESCLESLYQETHTVEASCDELSNSVRLRQLLGIVLTFGNRLNTAGKGKKKKAGAFTLDSLLKLNQAKAFDKKTTFLNYIVQIVQKNSEILLRFKDDLPTIFKADKVFWDQCVNDLEEVENQLENVRKIALYTARQAKKFRRQKKKKHHEGGDDDDDESLSDMSLSLEEEVEALRSSPIGLFTLSAIKKVSFLRDRVEGTKVKFQKLLEYFGEDEKNTQPHELFSTMVKFCSDFDKAKEQVFADDKKKKREERKRQSVSANSQPPVTKTPGRKPPQHNRGMVRLSSMQPNASRLIDDMKRNSPAVSNQDAPIRAKEEPRQIRSPSLVSQPQVPPLDSSTVSRRASTPIVSPRARQSSNVLVPAEASPRRTTNLPVQEVPRQSTGGQSFGFDLGEMQQHAAKLTQQKRYAPSNLASEQPPLPSRESTPIQMTEGSVNRRMQVQNRAEYSHDASAIAAQSPVHESSQQRPSEELDTSLSSTETGSTALRRKARMRGRRHTHSPGVSSPEQQLEDAPTPAYAAHMDGHNSEPAVTSPPSEHRASSGGPHSSPNMNSSLLRNKLRNKRMAERQQRSLGQ